MAELTDVFNNDVFSLASMSRGVDQADTEPRELRDSNLFVADPRRTDIVGIEYRNGKLEIADIDQRGDPIKSRGDDDRVIKHIQTVRVARKDKIMASQLQFVRDIGDVSAAITSVQQEIARRQTGPTGLMSQCDNRVELMRLGAMQGKVLDQNGKVIWDFYDLFGIPEPPTIGLALGTLSDGAFRHKLESQITRPMRRKAKGLPVSRAEAWCGEQFWDDLMKNPEFYATYNEQQKGEERRSGTLGATVNFAGITWKEYFGADDGTSINIDVDRAKVIPSGQTGMFKHIQSPGETFAELGHLGQEWYSYIDMDKHQRWVDLWTMTYPAMVNTRPDLVWDLQTV